MFTLNACFPIVFVDNPYSLELQNELVALQITDSNSLINTLNELQSTLEYSNNMMSFSDIEIEVDQSTFTNPSVMFALVQNEIDTDKIFVVSDEQSRVILHHDSIPESIIKSLFSPSIRNDSTAMSPLQFGIRGDCTIHVYEYWFDGEVRKTLVATVSVTLPQIDAESLIITDIGNITTQYR